MQVLSSLYKPESSEYTLIKYYLDHLKGPKTPDVSTKEPTKAVRTPLADIKKTPQSCLPPSSIKSILKLQSSGPKKRRVVFAESDEELPSSSSDEEICLVKSKNEVFLSIYMKKYNVLMAELAFHPNPLSQSELIIYLLYTYF